MISNKQNEENKSCSCEDCKIHEFYIKTVHVHEHINNDDFFCLVFLSLCIKIDVEIETKNQSHSIIKSVPSPRIRLIVSQSRHTLRSQMKLEKRIVMLTIQESIHF